MKLQQSRHIKATSRLLCRHTSQTFDDGFSTKDIGIDQAYVDWKITDELNFFGGKMKNPLFRAGGVPLEREVRGFKKDRFGWYIVC